MAAPAVRLTVRMTDTRLQANIGAMSRATGKTLKEETGTVFKGMLRDAINITPPLNGKVSRGRGQRVGELSVTRDLNRMGFKPVEIKGRKVYNKTFWGHQLRQPLVIPTKENPKFADPDAIHVARLAAKHGGRVTRGGRQAWYVDRQKFNIMLKRLMLEVGSLASGWAAAALDFGLPVPPFIKRHWALGRGSQVQITETANKIRMRVTNHFPADADALAAQTQRQIDFIKRKSLRGLRDRLRYVLRANLRAAKR